MCMYMCMYIYTPEHIKKPNIWHCLELCRQFGCLFYLLYFYLERKIGFGAVSVSESALFDF